MHTTEIETPPEALQATNERRITAGRVVKYALLPGVTPRLRRLAGAVDRFLFMYTQIFGTVGLIDKHHPCLRPENIGMYKFSYVVGLAMGNIRFTRQGVPQLLMFTAAISSLILMIATIILTVMNLGMPVHEAHAQYFGTPTSPGYGVAGGDSGLKDDWVFQFLGRVFGETGFWTKGNVEGSPVILQLLLQGMLKGYSTALLIIAVFMIIYLLVITVAESAKTGQPFGTRFDSVWAPIRLALAFMLLVPVTSLGYNTAQVITFQVAEWGSNLATNLWLGAIDNVKSKTATEKVVIAPQPTDKGVKFVSQFFLIKVCMEGLIKIQDLSSGDPIKVKYRTTEGRYVEALYGTTENPTFCGIMRYPLASGVLSKTQVPQDISVTNGFLYKVLAMYRTGLAQNALYVGDTTPNGMEDVARRLATKKLQSADTDAAEIITPPVVAGWMKEYYKKNGAEFKDDNYVFFSETEWRDSLKPINEAYFKTLSEDARWGWATAGVFYLRLATLTKTISDVVDEYPKITQLPKNISQIDATPSDPEGCTGTERAQARLAMAKEATEKIPGCTPSAAGLMLGNLLIDARSALVNAASNESTAETQVSPQDSLISMIGSVNRWEKSIENSTGVEIKKANLDAAEEVVDVIKEVLKGLAMNMKFDEINPLAVVVSYGGTLMDWGIACYMWALGLSVLTFGSVGSVMETVGGLLFAAGFVLGIVVPLMPFFYLMFAVVEWIISVIEAVIGVPLWCLSFISLEGDALGKAMSGVMKLFELLLRPSIIIMSLIASVLVFTASMGFVNQSLGSYNVAVQPLSQRVFSTTIQGVQEITMIFVNMFVIYSMANSSFKLIDEIPNQFMSWIGGPNGFNSGIRAGLANVNPLLMGAAASRLSGSATNAVRGTVGGGVNKIKQGIGGIMGG